MVLLDMLTDAKQANGSVMEALRIERAHTENNSSFKYRSHFLCIQNSIYLWIY